MSKVNLAEYLFVKYAADQLQGDVSFGVFINPEKTRILKDKLILVYDKINKNITQLPEFQRMNKDLEGEFYLNVFNDLINSLVVKVEKSSLKDGFSYAIQMIKALNELRGSLRFRREMPKSQKAQLDHNIKNVQDTIWEESKRFLNIHDLRGLQLEFPELKNIINEIVPTWDYGKGRNPTRKPLGQRHRGESVSQMMERLEKENELHSKEKKNV